MSDITVVHRPEAFRFEAMTGQDLAGYLSYEERQEGRVLDLQHTVVDEERRGQGIAGRLVEATVDHARQAGLRVVATCPYVARWIDEHPEAADLVEPGTDG